LGKVSKLLGISGVTLNVGLKELEDAWINTPSKSKNRRPGEGRKKETAENQSLQKEIEDILSPYTVGGPMRFLQWTSKSLRNIEEILEPV